MPQRSNMIRRELWGTAKGSGKPKRGQEAETGSSRNGVSRNGGRQRVRPLCHPRAGNGFSFERKVTLIDRSETFFERKIGFVHRNEFFVERKMIVIDRNGFFFQPKMVFIDASGVFFERKV